jgi:hypothetical protein
VEYGNLIHFCEVQWLSKEKNVEAVLHLGSEISDDWVTDDLAFLLDVTAYLNKLNFKLQGENQLVHHL